MDNEEKLLRRLGYGVIFLSCVFVLFLFGTIGCSMYGGIDSTYSEGKRVGVITKFTNKGFFCKTWEGEMNLGGLRDGGKNGAVANTWEFSDPSGSFADALNAVADSGQPCVIHYKQVLIRSVWAADSDYYVTAVEPLEKMEGK